MTTTQHGQKRMRQRLGVPKCATRRLAGEALLHGRPPSDYSGDFRQYLEKYRRQSMPDAVLKVYHQQLFIFIDNHLVTCWGIPGRFRKAAL